ncbi:Alpha/Beta hydrolase protein [Entophlyctis helioformis]|nr:Alpha/Beta hydrolase protein [Entophlyctis helioformis]
MASTPVYAPIFGAPHKTLAIDKGSIAYEVGKPAAGVDTGRVAIALPGLGDLRQTYRFVGPKLVEQGITFIAVDLRGTGDSTTSFSSFGVDAIASDVLAVLDAEGYTSTPAIMLGNSFSAAVAVFLAGNHANRIAAVIGLSGFYRDMPNDTVFRPVSHLMFTTLYGKAMWMSYYRTLFKTPTLPSDHEAYVSAMGKSMSAECKRAVIVGHYVRASKAAAWDAASRVSCPALILLGEQDPDFGDTKAELETVRKGIADNGKGALVVAKLVPATGHYPQAEAPDVVVADIVSFLREANLL